MYHTGKALSDKATDDGGSVVADSRIRWSHREQKPYRSWYTTSGTRGYRSGRTIVFDDWKLVVCEEEDTTSTGDGDDRGGRGGG